MTVPISYHAIEFNKHVSKVESQSQNYNLHRHYYLLHVVRISVVIMVDEYGLVDEFVVVVEFDFVVFVVVRNVVPQLQSMQYL